MKKSIVKFSMAMVLAVMMIVTSLIGVSAATSKTLLDSSKKVEFSVTCDKVGYTFNVYKVANLVSNSASPYETKYDSLVSSVSSAEVTKDIKDGNSVGLLAALDTDKISDTLKVGSFGPTSATNTTAKFSNLDQGIYYVKAVNYPAGVKEVRNSIFALPYYPSNEKGWTYEIDSIPLATKVVDEDITTKKTITNSTKGNENFTDVSLGDTVDFEIKSTVTGEKSHVITTPAGDKYTVEDFKLNSYYVTDDMSKGLTLSKNSFKVTLQDESGKVVKTLSGTGATPDYTVTYETGFDGSDITKNTKFTVALSKDFLQKDYFYEDDVYYTSVTYSAVLNKEAVVGPKGNPNTEPKISYSNKNDVVQEHEGNTVYVYTYGVTSTKNDPDNKPLAGATFELYKTEADAKAQTNAIAKGVSDAQGKVVYKNSKNEEIRLSSGTYYAVETIAPEGYNLYGKVITVDLSATYNDTLTNDTYVKTCQENGTATFSVIDTKLMTPKTGGFGDTAMYVGAIAVGSVAVLGLAIYGIVAMKRKKREN